MAAARVNAPSRRMILALLGVSLCSVSRAHDEHGELLTFRRYLAEWPSKRFLQLLRETGMDVQVESMPAVTVFVPQDGAWNEGARGAASGASRDDRLWLARQHICVGAWPADASRFSLQNLNGQTVSGDTSAVNGTGFTLQGMQVRNGYLHFIAGFIA